MRDRWAKFKKQIIHIFFYSYKFENVFRPPDNKSQLVGVESRVEEIESLLSVESKDVYAVGIWGIGVIGKTTIARDCSRCSFSS